jgi:methionine aminotransferase
LKTSRFELLPCEGTYFQVASTPPLLNENDVDFCKRLITEYGVAAIPISSFYENGKDLHLIRFFVSQRQCYSRRSGKSYAKI